METGGHRKRVIILGAGVTGLSAGIRFLDSGYNVCILEKAAHPGGLAKTVVRGNYRLDIGPHHLFSQNETILKEITDLFESDELVSFSRDAAKILFYDRFLDYPLTARSVLSQMGLKHAFFGSVSYIWMAFRNLFGLEFRENSFRAWARNHFGDYMYKIFFKPYTEQFWGVPCEEMSTDCVPQATKMSFMKTLKRIFLKKYAGESLSIEELETAPNFYPVKGVGAIVEKLKDSFLSKGGTIRLNCDVLGLIRNEDRTFTVHCQNEVESFKDKAVYVVSSIPISSLVRILKPAPPVLVLQSADSLKYLSTIVLYIVIPDRDFIDCAYIYMPSRPYNRISNTNRFHQSLSPKEENMLAVEITCHFNDEIWKSSDEELYENCIGYLESDGFVNRDDVKQYFTVRAKNAYPFYRVGYKENLAAIFEYFKHIPNLSLAGRTGAFKYMDIDKCMEDTAGLIKQLKAGGVI